MRSFHFSGLVGQIFSQYRERDKTSHSFSHRSLVKEIKFIFEYVHRKLKRGIYFAPRLRLVSFYMEFVVVGIAGMFVCRRRLD